MCSEPHHTVSTRTRPHGEIAGEILPLPPSILTASRQLHISYHSPLLSLSACVWLLTVRMLVSSHPLFCTLISRRKTTNITIPCCNDSLFPSLSWSLVLALISYRRGRYVGSHVYRSDLELCLPWKGVSRRGSVSGLASLLWAELVLNTNCWIWRKSA